VNFDAEKFARLRQALWQYDSLAGLGERADSGPDVKLVGHRSVEEDSAGSPEFGQFEQMLACGAALLGSFLL